MTTSQEYERKMWHCLWVNFEDKNNKLIFGFVLGVLFALNCWAAFYGLPQMLNADEIIFIRGAFNILRPPYGDPQWYGAPASFTMDVLALAYVPYILYLKVFMGIDNPGEYLLMNPQGHVLIGRLVHVVIYAVSVIAVLALAKRLMHERAAVLAALIFAVSPQIIAYAHIIRMDHAMILFLTLVMYYCVDIQRGEKLKYYIYAGAALGIAVVCKYPAVVGCLSIIWASYAAWQGAHIKFWQALKYLFAAAGSSLLAAFVFAPFLFINYQEMLQDVIYEARDMHIGATSFGFFDNIIFYFTDALPYVSGVGVFLCLLPGIFLGLKNKNFQPVFVFSVFFLIFISSLSLQWVRWAIPFALILSLAAGFVCAYFLNKSVKPSILLKIIGGLIILSAVLPSFYLTILRGAKQDTAIVAEKWIAQNIPQDSRVLVETFAPQLKQGRLQIYITGYNAFGPLGEVESGYSRPIMMRPTFGEYFAKNPSDLALLRDIDYIIFSDMAEKYKNERTLFREQASVYENMYDKYEEIKVIAPDWHTLGRTIRIYKAR